MHRLLTATMVGLLAGLGLGLLLKLPDPPLPPPAPVEASTESHANMRVGSAFATGTPLLGSRLVQLEKKIEAIGGNDIDVTISDPSHPVPPNHLFDAVARGELDAGWASPSAWVDRDSAFALFGAVPFGPLGTEFTAWMFRGGGLDLMRALFQTYGLVAVPCGLAPQRAGGWFRTPIKNLDDLKGLKMRAMGFAAQVLQRIGVETVRLPPGKVYYELQQGSIDAAEFSFPAIDLDMGFYQLAKYYYFPGWQQQSSLLVLIINEKYWNELSMLRQARIETACGDSIADSLADGAAAQSDALNQLVDKGVEMKLWPPEVLAALRKSWEEIAKAEADKNPAFKAGWESLSTFRARYQAWRELSQLR